MVVKRSDLWGLVLRRPEIDPNDLAKAIEVQVVDVPLDYRTRLLIRDSVDALRRHWGPRRLNAWLQQCSNHSRIEAICQESFERPGFPALVECLMEKTSPDEVKQYLRELGDTLHRKLELNIGGSIALILPGYLSRRTDDIDIVDEVPAELRTQYQLLADLKKRYRLELTHFQGHYLPSGWERRVHSIESQGKLHIFLVDVYDVFLSKLFSSREKDRDDLRVLIPQLDKETLVRRLTDTTASLRKEEKLLRAAEKNWHILFGEPLPS